MKSKLTTLFLFICFLSIGQSVPDTETFSLQDVVNVVNPTTDDLVDCFSDSNASYFDPLHGSKTMNPQTLLGFRNYRPNCAGLDVSVDPSLYPNTHTVDLGTSTGTVTLTFNPSSVPDMVLVYWNGVLQINSGYIGSYLYGCSGTFRSTLTNYLDGKTDPIYGGTYPNSNHDECGDEYPDVTNTTQYINTFSKNTSSSSCTIYVYPSKSTSGYSFTMSCPQ
jgi:hypothetical protein